MAHAALESRRDDIIDEFWEKGGLKNRNDMLLRIGAGISLVLLFGAMIAGGVIGYKHLPEDYNPAIVFASVVLSPLAVVLLAAPFVCLAKAIKDKQQKEPSSLINESSFVQTDQEKQTIS